MNSADPNPYAPPAESLLNPPLPSMVTLRVLGPIRFSGSATQGELREFLQADGHVGCTYLGSLGFVVGVLLFALFAQGGGLSAIAIGAAGLFVVASVVSTLPYRVRVFENGYPEWREKHDGELRVDGIHLDRRDSQVFFRWDWYWNAVIGDDWVALLPATAPMQPQIITHSMVGNRDDWRRVQQVAGAIAQRAHDSGEQQQRQHNFRLIRKEGRPRSVEVPSGAIAFHGIVRADDFSRLPKNHRRREKPARSYVVVGTLFLGGACIVAGASKLLLQQFAFLPAFLLIYAALAAIGIAVRKRRRGTSLSGVAYYTNGYATESSIVSDFEISTSEIEWSELQLAVRSDHFIALKRRRKNQFILVRRDMFAGDRDWGRFNAIVDRKLE